jgi:hypothetical protein
MERSFPFFLVEITTLSHVLNNSPHPFTTHHYHQPCSTVDKSPMSGRQVSETDFCARGNEVPWAKRIHFLLPITRRMKIDGIVIHPQIRRGSQYGRFHPSISIVAQSDLGFFMRVAVSAMACGQPGIRSGQRTD